MLSKFTHFSSEKKDLTYPMNDSVTWTVPVSHKVSRFKRYKGSKSMLRYTNMCQEYCHIALFDYKKKSEQVFSTSLKLSFPHYLFFPAPYHDGR